MKKRFIIYGLAGWCIEVFWTGMNGLFSGDPKLLAQTSLWMFFIYGMAVFLEPIHNQLRHRPILMRGCVYTVCIYIIEYSTGAFLRIFGLCPWDYTGAYFSIHGLIRLDYAPAWFIASILFEIVHDRLLLFERIFEDKELDEVELSLIKEGQGEY